MSYSAANVIELPTAAYNRERAFEANAIEKELLNARSINAQYERIFDKINRGKYITQTQIMRDYNKVITQ